MILFGITGGIGHGKSTLAEAFLHLEPNALHLELSDIITEVANALHAATTILPDPHNLSSVLRWLQPLPQILQDITHIQTGSVAFTADDIAMQPALYEKLFVHLDTMRSNPQLLQTTITQANKNQYRPILQWLGGYLVSRVSPSIWTSEAVRRAKVAGANGTALCSIGGLRYPTDAEVLRNSAGKVIHIRRPLITEQDLSDPTERERNKIIPDTMLLNDGNLSQLVSVAAQLLLDTKVGKLRAQYAASDPALA
jgi:hypothetical protein